MKIWNYIGEFLLFRWLFSKLKKSEREHNAHIDDLGTSIDRDNEYLNVNHNEGIPPINDAVTAVGDGLIDDSENSEDLDDLDIFMRDNKGNNCSCLHHGDYGSDYHSNGRYSNHNDWDAGSFNQSYDDFLDEQDDYDMMDDDF